MVPPNRRRQIAGLKDSFNKDRASWYSSRTIESIKGCLGRAFADHQDMQMVTWQVEHFLHYFCRKQLKHDRTL